MALSRGFAVGSEVLQGLGTAVGYAPADITLGLRTMGRRKALLGEAYPFRASVGAVRYARRERPCVDCAALDEFCVSGAALDSALGSRGPPRARNRRGSSLPLWLWHEIGSLRLALRGRSTLSVSRCDQVALHRRNVPVGKAFRSPYSKDGGVDVVAWRPFPDGRSGFPVLLAQCTIEKDYRHKAGDVDTRIWSGRRPRMSTRLRPWRSPRWLLPGSRGTRWPPGR